MKFNYDYTPEKRGKKPAYINNKPVISIITAYYKGKDYIEETATSVFNQTYPFFEWLIVCDGKQSKDDNDILEKIAKQDSRVKIMQKEHSGASQTRDYGANKASKYTKYLFFLDPDDLIENTYLEHAYWALETNPTASWSYGHVVNFGNEHYIWHPNFNCRTEKRENLLVLTALIKKDDFLKVNGFGIKAKAMYEDWNLWLKLLAVGCYPVHTAEFCFWYRRKSNGELSKAKAQHERAMKIINETARTVKKDVPLIEFPRENFHWDKPLDDKFFKKLVLPKYKKNKKIKILMMIPWMVMGGADKFNLDLMKMINRDLFEITIVVTEPNINPWQQEFSMFASEIHNLPAFIDRNYWIKYIEYLISSRNIDIILNTNCLYGYYALPSLKMTYPEIPIVDYVHMEEWYNRNGGYCRDSSVFESVIDLTLTCNQNSQKILANYFGRNNSELDTVYIGVDENHFDSKDYNVDLIKEKYKISNHKKIISYVARIDYQKRPYLLLEIIKELKKVRRDCLFIVIGDGPLLEDIKAKSEQYNISDMMMFLGAKKDVREYYAISDLTLNCSIKEGLALTTYESLSMGVPVISSNVGGQAEIIDDKVGKIIPCIQKETDIHNINYSHTEVNSYVNAIINILNSKEDYKSRTRNRILDGFTIKHMIKSMEEHFINLHKNPNIKKIENGKNLVNYKNMVNDILMLFLQMDRHNYSWACNQFYNDLAHINDNKDNKRSKTKLIDKSIVKRFLVKIHLYDEASDFALAMRKLFGIPIKLVKRAKNYIVELRK